MEGFGVLLILLLLVLLLLRLGLRICVDVLAWFWGRRVAALRDVHLLGRDLRTWILAARCGARVVNGNYD